MNDYELSVSVEPKDRYEKAERDLIQAIKSFEQLNFQEQQQLASEILGAAQVDLILRILQQYKNTGRV